MKSHDWKNRGGNPTRTWSHEKLCHVDTRTPEWQSCKSCGVSNGMAEHMGWTECQAKDPA